MKRFILAIIFFLLPAVGPMVLANSYQGSPDHFLLLLPTVEDRQKAGKLEALFYEYSPVDPAVAQEAERNQIGIRKLKSMLPEIARHLGRRESDDRLEMIELLPAPPGTVWRGFDGDEPFEFVPELGLAQVYVPMGLTPKEIAQKLNLEIELLREWHKTYDQLRKLFFSKFHSKKIGGASFAKALFESNFPENIGFQESDTGFEVRLKSNLHEGLPVLKDLVSVFEEMPPVDVSSYVLVELNREEVHLLNLSYDGGLLGARQFKKLDRPGVHIMVGALVDPTLRREFLREEFLSLLDLEEQLATFRRKGLRIKVGTDTDDSEIGQLDRLLTSLARDPEFKNWLDSLDRPQRQRLGRFEFVVGRTNQTVHGEVGGQLALRIKTLDAETQTEVPVAAASLISKFKFLISDRYQLGFWSMVDRIENHDPLILPSEIVLKPGALPGPLLSPSKLPILVLRDLVEFNQVLNHRETIEAISGLFKVRWTILSYNAGDYQLRAQLLDGAGQTRFVTAGHQDKLIGTEVANQLRQLLFESRRNRPAANESKYEATISRATCELSFTPSTH